MREPQSDLGPAIGALTSYQFYLTNTNTPANVYQDGNLTTPYPATGFVSADIFGRFPPIYLDSSIIYKVTFNGLNGYTWTVNAYTPPLATTGTSQNSPYGINIAKTGECVIPAPNAGGTGLSLTLKAGALGSAPLRVSSTIAGQNALIINSSATTGAQTATFAATNKPGTATSAPTAWLPLVCDGVQYYMPLWFDNNFERYTATPGAIGETISAVSVTFNGNGSTTATGGTANPSSWYLPNTTNIGGSYYITLTPTPGVGNLSGMGFYNGATNISGTPTNISTSGLTITENAAAQLIGTYTLSTNSSGTPVVASGSITLAGGNGPTSAAYNVATPLNVATNGTTTDGNNNAQANWYAPTTAAIGSNYWISVNQTGGTAGYSFSGVSTTPSAPTSMSSALAIGISGPTGANYFVSGTYTISTDSGGANVVATASITLNGGNPIQSPNWSGTPPLNLAANGTATLNGVSTSSWYSPTTAGVGAGYWIDIVRTSGTTGVNFSAAQGSWTNISNSGLNIGLSSYTGDVGTVTVNGNWSISNSSSGSPVLGNGTITLSVTGLTVIHVYTTGSNATETVPTGSTTAVLEIWGGGAGGTAGTGSGCGALPGAGGGAGGYARTSFAVSTKNGLTWKYTVGAAGAAAANGGAGSIVAGTMTGFTTMTGNGGQTSHVGGTASGGTQANTTGAAGSGRTGGTGTTGTVSGDGSPYGGGGTGGLAGAGHSGSAGLAGAAVFYYT